LSDAVLLRRDAKLRLPITLKMNDAHLVWSDGVGSFQLDTKRLDQCNLKAIDQDGFVHFEIAEVTSKRQTEENGYKLFDSSEAEGGPGVYDYFKRDSDRSFYYQVRIGNRISARHDLGSLKDPDSKISRVARLFSMTDSKAKIDLWNMDLPPGLKSGQVFKSATDILVKEGLLRRTTKTSESGRELEAYLRTDKNL